MFRAYKNTGNIDNFAAVNLGLPPVRNGKFKFGDMFGQGRNDVVYSGTVSGQGTFSRIAYYDAGAISYIDSNYDLFLDDADIGMADFDGDLDTDIVLTGKWNGDPTSYNYHGYVYINGKKNQLPERAKLQFSYLVQPKKNKFNKRVMINNYDITDRFGPINSNYTYKFMGISEKSLEKLKNHTNVSWIKKDTFPKGYRDSSVFPQNPSFDWNNDFFGPIYIPQKNKSIKITKANLPIYKRLIEVYENNKLEIKGSEIYINGVQTNEYKFKQDYYWLMGDNRSNSQDSRTWGFVPFDHVVGKPVFKWLSIDYNAKGFNKIRWNRMFTTVHGKGKPNSYLIHFIVVILGLSLIHI